MYRIDICDAGYEVLKCLIQDFMEDIMRKEENNEDDTGALLGCFLLLDDISQAEHYEV